MAGQKSHLAATPTNPYRDNSGNHISIQKAKAEESPTSFDRAALEITRGMTSGDGDLTGATSGFA